MPPPDRDVESFQDLLQEERTIPLSELLQRHLIDGILLRVEEPIRHQSMCLGYDSEMISHLFSNWILNDAGSALPLRSDEWWRCFHGRSDELVRLAQVAIRFSTLKCSGANAERLLRLQRTFQGLHGMNYHTGTLPA
jgi:hypothetical protein